MDEHWEVNFSRKEVVAWPDNNGYALWQCGEIACEQWMAMRCRGTIYIETVVDPNRHSLTPGHHVWISIIAICLTTH